MGKLNPYKENRVGKFFISTECIDNDWDLSCIFGRMIIIRAESLFHMHGIDYVAYSDLFEIVDPGVEPPYYRIIIEAGVVVAKRDNKIRYNGKLTANKDGDSTYVNRRLDAIVADCSTGYIEGKLHDIESRG